MLFGVAAIVLAAAPGVVGGRVLSQRFAALMNFDLATLSVPVWVYLLVAVVGLLVPLAAAAYPGVHRNRHHRPRGHGR